jgi:uncharacterized protein YdaU (DUF1376 family)
MPFNVIDYRADTGHLTLIEDIVYRRLLDEYWVTGKPLPDDEKRLATIVKMSLKQFKIVFPAVKRFFKSTGQSLTHRRVDEELAIIEEKSQKYAKNAESRWSNGNAIAYPIADATADATAMPSHAGKGKGKYKQYESKAPYSTSVNNQKPMESDIEFCARSKKSNDRPTTNKMRGTRWGDQQVPDDWIEEARLIRDINGLTEIDLRVEAASFADYWKSVAGAKGIKLDWRATWRNWARRANGRPSQGQPRRGGSITADLQQALDYFDKNGE